MHQSGVSDAGTSVLPQNEVKVERGRRAASGQGSEAALQMVICAGVPDAVSADWRKVQIAFGKDERERETPGIYAQFHYVSVLSATTAHQPADRGTGLVKLLEATS